MESKSEKWISNLYLVFVFIFLYVPIFIIIVYSFNKSKTNSAWTGFTLQWYEKLIQDDNTLTALKNSLTVAVSSSIISALVGTLGAVGMYKHDFKGKGFINMLLYVPIVIPEIIMGVSFLALFSAINMQLGTLTLILAHTTFCIPFVLINVNARLAGFDHNIEEAAQDLGASKFKVFTTVTLPLIFPGVLAGTMLAFALSMDDVIINFFVSGPESTTLPIRIFSMIRFGLSPEINALCTLMLVITIVTFIISQIFSVKKTK
jgi:spermidine/putrescine transport system permease protein